MTTKTTHQTTNRDITHQKRSEFSHHSSSFRVYYEDTDAGGIMYHARYIAWCERGRSEYLRALGMECSRLAEDHGFLFVIRHLSADYLKPARLDEVLQVETWLEEMKNSSFILGQLIKRGDEILFSMKATLVCVSKEAKPIRIPQMVRERLLEK